jgi:hypothetical protein
VLLLLLLLLGPPWHNLPLPLLLLLLLPALMPSLVKATAQQLPLAARQARLKLPIKTAFVC